MKYVLILFLFLSFTPVGHAAIKEQAYEYKQGDQILEGFLAYDTKGPKKKPVVIVVHEWNGLGDYAKKRARMLAGLGYVAFAADIYGKGIRGTSAEENGKLAGIYKNDRKLMRERIKAALDVAEKLTQYDGKNIAVIGYCFGGTVALELARSGADIKGVVSFHGGLSTPTPDDAKNIKAKVLVLHGADDPYANTAEVRAFEDQMKKTKADWQVVLYSNAVHAFTNSDNGTDNSAGIAYNENADKRSWIAMQDFFKEIFK